MDPRQKPQRFEGSGALNRHCARSGHGENRSGNGSIGTHHAPVTVKSRPEPAPFPACPPSSLPALPGSDEGASLRSRQLAGLAPAHCLATGSSRALAARIRLARSPQACNGQRLWTSGTASMPIRRLQEPNGHGWRYAQIKQRALHCPGVRLPGAVKRRSYPCGPCRAAWVSARNRRIGSSVSGAKPNLS